MNYPLGIFSHCITPTIPVNSYLDPFGANYVLLEIEHKGLSIKGSLLSPAGVRIQPGRPRFKRVSGVEGMYSMKRLQMD
jgi:hypothetical protein